MRHRVAIAGLGRAARTIHLPALRKLADVEMVGGYDPVAALPGVPAFPSLEALLEATRPDILTVASPPSEHVAAARAGLAAGCHIVCEKPLATTLAEADELAALARRAGRHVVVNSEFPFMPIHEAARAMIGDPRFGRLLFVEARQYFAAENADGDAAWRGADPQRSFKEFGTHVIDLCKAFFGERPSALRARMPRPLAEGGGPDFLDIVQLDFSGDRVAQIMLDRLTRGPHRYLDVRLVGEHATIETSIGGRARAAIGLRTPGRRPFLDLEIAGGGQARLYRGERATTIARAPLDLFADATSRLYRAVLDAIDAGVTPPNAIDEARDTLALLYAAYDAADDGQPRALG